MVPKDLLKKVFAGRVESLADDVDLCKSILDKHVEPYDSTPVQTLTLGMLRSSSSEPFSSL